MDREKVIKQLEKCVNDTSCIGCPYEKSLVCRHYMIADAIKLLKEQEAIVLKPHYIDKYGKQFICGVECGNCGIEISATYKFCPYCGRAVKWEWDA